MIEMEAIDAIRVLLHLLIQYRQKPDVWNHNISKRHAWVGWKSSPWMPGIRDGGSSNKERSDFARYGWLVRTGALVDCKHLGVVPGTKARVPGGRSTEEDQCDLSPGTHFGVTDSLIRTIE